MSARTQHWQRWDVLDDSNDLIYFTQSWDPIDAEALVKTLRTDGVVNTLWDAQVRFVAARVERCYYGYVDGDIVPTLCNPDGSTETGDFVDEAIAGVFVYLSE
jgi:hypothetical protein